MTLLGGILLIALVVAVVVAKQSPERYGIQPFGAGPAAPGIAVLVEQEWTTAEAFSREVFGFVSADGDGSGFEGVAGGRVAIFAEGLLGVQHAAAKPVDITEHLEGFGHDGIAVIGLAGEVGGRNIP